MQVDSWVWKGLGSVMFLERQACWTQQAWCLFNALSLQSWIIGVAFFVAAEQGRAVEF